MLSWIRLQTGRPCFGLRQFNTRAVWRKWPVERNASRASAFNFLLYLLYVFALEK